MKKLYALIIIQVIPIFLLFGFLLFGFLLFGRLNYAAAQAVSPNNQLGNQPGTQTSQATSSANATDEDGEAATDLDASTEINVKNADISAIVRIFGKKTKRNYILDERVKGKVSIFLPGKVSDEEALRILDSVLALKGFSAVPISENLWKILPAKEAKQSTIPTLTNADEVGDSSAMVTRLVNLKYVGADDAKNLVTPLISGDGLINAYAGTNSLIIIDSADNIERLMKIVESIDVPFSDREMTVIPIKHADAVDIAQKLGEILGINTSSGTKGSAQQGSSADTAMDLLRARMRDAATAAHMNLANTAKPPGSGGDSMPPGMSSGMSASQNQNLARSREPKIIPDERTNSIIVVADDDTTGRIMALTAQLDSDIDLGGKRFYVYRCKYANAEELSQSLSGTLSSSSNSSSSNSRGFGGGDSAGDDSSGISGSGRNSRSSGGTTRSGDRMSLGRRNPGESRLGRDRRGGSGAVSLGDDITIFADPATNSLIINSDKTGHQKVLDLLKDLDIKRKQVLVEAMLLEVGVDDQTQLETNFLTSAGGKDGGLLAKNDFSGNLASLFSDPQKLSNFSVAAASAGTLQLPGEITIPTQTILLTAAQSNSNVNVLSAPTILATDNEPAEIVVGQNVPFLASTSTSDANLNNTFNQIDRQDVGITLRLTPQISGDELVRLQLFTEVSNVISTTDLGPTTTIRTSETSVITKDSQMIVIGGLMSDDVSDSDSGVPFLKDIPVLGHLFRGSLDRHRRTNLLIFITPRIVRDQYDAREATMVNRDILKKDIKDREIWPNREEVLENQDMNRVAEARQAEHKDLGTILPPEKLTDKAVGEELNSEVQSGTSPTSNQNGAKLDEIQLAVSPKFPDFGDSPKGSLASRIPKTNQHDLFVLAKLTGKMPSNPDLPFELAPSDPIIALNLPAEASFDPSFFKSGEALSYRIDDDRSLSFRILGIFPNLAEAQTFKGDSVLKSYTLSPYEIMNLGQGPWTH